MEIEKTKLEFDNARIDPNLQGKRKNPNCVVCHRPIWHTQFRGPLSNVCGVSCSLSRKILGGGRSMEDTWELMRKNKLCEWETMEAWWRDMGHLHFPGAFLIRRNRGAKHSKENSIWVPYQIAKRVNQDMLNETKGKRLLANGMTIGQLVESYGVHITIFQRSCGGISKRYGIPIDQVYLEFGAAPPPSINWMDEISVQHQGQEYSIRRIAKETGISCIALYWRWMKGMYLIDDSISYRLSRIRTSREGRRNQLKRFQDYMDWQG